MGVGRRLVISIKNIVILNNIFVIPLARRLRLASIPAFAGTGCRDPYVSRREANKSCGLALRCCLFLDPRRLNPPLADRGGDGGGKVIWNDYRLIRFK